MHQHLHYRGTRRRRERERVWENIWRDNGWKIPLHGKETVTQVQEAQRVPYRINPKRNTLRYMVIKMTKIKDKERIIKAATEKQQITHKGTSIRLSADFSAETLQVRREWHNIFKVMKRKNLQPRIPSKALIQIWQRNQKLYRQAKAKRIQHHQTSFTTNAKGTSLGEKEKATTRNKKAMKWKVHQ